MYKLEFYKDEGDEWRWRLVSLNGNIVATSGEGYKNRSDCAEIALRILDRQTEVDTSAAY